MPINFEQLDDVPNNPRLGQVPSKADASKPHEWEIVRIHAANACRARNTELTTMRETVLAELFAANVPLGAYELASRVSARLNTQIAPNTIYRIVKLLQSIGVIVHIASKHSYCVVSSAPGETGDVLLICDDCGGVTTTGNSEIRHAVAALSQALRFHATRQVVEVTGRCPECEGSGSHHD